MVVQFKKQKREKMYPIMEAVVKPDPDKYCKWFCVSKSP